MGKGSFYIIRSSSGDSITVVNRQDEQKTYKVEEPWIDFISFIDTYDEVYIKTPNDQTVIDENSLLVIEPRYLVSVTETLKAISCPRKIYVKHMGASSSYDRILHQRQVKGNLLHDVFTHKLVHDSSVKDAINTTLEKNKLDLILADFDRQTARRYLNEDAMSLQAFSFDGDSEIDVKHYGHGLVGKLDGKTTTDMIIELKSSKIPDTTPWPNHNIQMNIYQDMMEDYLEKRPKGKVLYVSDSQFSIKNPTSWKQQTTIQARNWAYLVLSGRYVPPILRGEDKKTCRNCYRKEGCAQLCAGLIQQRDCDQCYHDPVCDKQDWGSENIEFFDTQTLATIAEEQEMKAQEYFGHRASFGTKSSIDTLTASKITENTDPFGTFVSEFSYQEEDTRFRRGDYVTVFPPEINEVVEISYMGRIVDISDQMITLQTNNELPTNVEIFPSTTSALIRRNRQSLFKSMLTTSRLTRLIISGSISPGELDQSLEPITHSQIEITDGLMDYNPAQQLAIKQSLSTDDFLLVQGPAGTGKTSVIVEIVHQLVKRGQSILVSAFTNMAVDNVGLQLHEHGIKFMRFGSRYSMNQNLRQYSIEENSDLFKEFTEDRSGKVILATTSTIGKNTFDDLFFDYVLIDEAAQMTIPDTLAPLLHGQRSILVGDHAQLQPIVISEQAIQLGFEQSLFEKLVDIDSRFVLLTDQYRMSDDILALPNEMFYEGRLNSATKDIANQNIEVNSDIISSDSYQVIALEADTHPDHSQSNQLEALVVFQVLFDLINDSGYKPEDIGVICPFRAQVALLRQYLPGFKIDTVDRFQGSEADIIIFSTTTMLDIPILADPRRINVALTRAKKKLIILQTNPSSITSQTLMRRIYRDALRRGRLSVLEKHQLDGIQDRIDKILQSVGSGSFQYRHPEVFDSDSEMLIYYNSIALVPIKLQEQQRCLICYQATNRGIQCPGCGYVYHEVQLKEWVEQRRSCPTCKHRLDLVNVS